MNHEANDLVDLFDVDHAADRLPGPSFNVAPTDLISIVLDSLPRDAGEDVQPIRRLEAARWGLVPPWAKDTKASGTAFNARVESARTKPHFANAVKKRRAVIPASGYYEWAVIDGVKTPQFIRLPGNELFLFAGLYEWWRDPAVGNDSPDRWLLSASILTRDATGRLAEVHDRMPIFLDHQLLDDWLDPAGEGTGELLDEVSAGGAVIADRALFHPVDPAVGNVRNNGPALIEPIIG